MNDAKALKDGLAEQGRILHALLLREIRVRFGRQRIGYAWALLEPMLHVAILYMLRSVVGGFSPPQIPLLLWLISGIVPYIMFRNIATRVAGIYRGNQDVLVLPPVQIGDIIIARILLEIATSTMTLVALLLLYAAIIGPIEIHNPLLIFGCMFLLAWLGLGFGTIAMVINSLFPSTQPLTSGILRVTYFASGVIFSVSRIHPDYQPYLTWNPLLHVFETLHAAFFATYHPVNYASDPGFAIMAALAGTLIGYILLYRFKHKVLEERI